MIFSSCFIVISHFWPMTGRLIEHLQSPEETFSRNTSQLMFTCSLRLYAWLYAWYAGVCVCVCVCVCVKAWPTCVWMSKCDLFCVAERQRVTRMSCSHGTIMELTFCQWHSRKCSLTSSFSCAPSLHFLHPHHRHRPPPPPPLSFVFAFI